ncbi:hypothetical protein AVEN_216085-1 [Araneus ventricosus]|uniref:Uncharacterized protein n=1 Tax=Araneus ventricosus TaxID=182803 RepID=A0A4Y2IWG0_ARAVE|nr:hypothetical protein AVEN_216085-1 [Araneus ventricosus]
MAFHFYAIHLCRPFTTVPSNVNPSATDHSDSLVSLLLPLIHANPRLLRFTLERESLSTYLHRSHFNIYGPAAQMKPLDIHTSEHTAPILIGFFALTTGFGVERSNLRGMESS